MQLCDLPEDILLSVLGQCLSKERNITRKLKHNLPLLAVNRQWRRLAIHMVYSQAFVQYGVNRSIGQGRDNGDLDVDEPTNAAVETNLDLIAGAGCSWAVKSLLLEVYCLANSFPGWQGIIERMGAVASKWRALELTVAIHPDCSYRASRNVDLAKYADAIVEVSDALAALMPEVRRLDCGGVNMNPIARSLYGRLAEHYADQLQLISSGHPFDVSPDRRFTKLQSLFICYDDKVDYQLPRIASGELVDMKLVGVPPNISWASFGTDSDPRVIEFAKLEKLCLKYMTLRDEDRALLPRQAVQPPDLRFPSLKKLDIHWTEDIVSLFKHAELPPRMESIYIGILSATPEQFAGVVLPETKRLSLGIPMTAFGRSNGLPIINHLFSRARGCESLEMRLGDMTQTIMPDDITCTNLTQLVIAGSVRVDTMLAFIGRMPRLAKLKLDRLDPVNIHTDISVPDADDDAVVEPISNSLKELVISYEWDWPVREILVDVAKYVLLRIPVLDTLVTTNTPRDPILGFVEAYSRRYPHLGRVELDIIEKDGIVGDRRRAGSSARSLITRHVSQES